MEPKDLSPYIEAISKNYLYPKTPKVISTFEDLTLSLLRYLVDFLSSLHIRVPYPTHENIMTIYMMLVIFVLATIAISAMVFVLIKSVKQTKSIVASRKPVDANLEPLLDSAAWLSVAQELASEKNFRSACRAIFLASLLTLDEKSIAEFTPALSNYEYLYKLSRHKDLQAKVRDLAYKVDSFWFGHEEAAANDFQLCLSLHQTICRRAEDVLERRLQNGQ